MPSQQNLIQSPWNGTSSFVDQALSHIFPASRSNSASSQSESMNTNQILLGPTRNSNWGTGLDLEVSRAGIIKDIKQQVWSVQDTLPRQGIIKVNKRIMQRTNFLEQAERLLAKSFSTTKTKFRSNFNFADADNDSDIKVIDTTIKQRQRQRQWHRNDPNLNSQCERVKMGFRRSRLRSFFKLKDDDQDYDAQEEQIEDWEDSNDSHSGKHFEKVDGLKPKRKQIGVGRHLADPNKDKIKQNDQHTTQDGQTPAQQQREQQHGQYSHNQHHFLWHDFNNGFWSNFWFFFFFLIAMDIVIALFRSHYYFRFQYANASPQAQPTPASPQQLPQQGQGQGQRLGGDESGNDYQNENGNVNLNSQGPNRNQAQLAAQGQDGNSISNGSQGPGTAVREQL